MMSFSLDQILTTDFWGATEIPEGTGYYNRGHMFHCFVVKEEHRNCLRFLWFRNNDMNSDIVDYGMNVHVFGNTPSPTVTIYGLRRATREEEDSYGSDVRKFVEEDYYVDDALKSFATEEEAISVLQRA